MQRVLENLPEAEIMDCVTDGAATGSFLLQYEESGWEFLVRLASCFGIFLVPDCRAEHGRAYFRIPELQYDAFGNELERAGQLPNRIRYTGQQYDDATGQYYLRARYYNPILGRFMQEDTYQGDGLNLYAYCRDNPVAYYDPSGYECDDLEKIASDGGNDFVVEIELSKSKYPESAKHIQDAIANGQPEILTIDRGGAKERRKASLKGVNTILGLDRDEYPPAMSLEGGKGASVRHIGQSDNRGSGPSISQKLKEYSDGTKYKIVIVEGDK